MQRLLIIKDSPFGQCDSPLFSIEKAKQTFYNEYGLARNP